MQSESAPEMLHRTLRSRSDGEVWLEYLKPDQVEGMIESGDQAALAELATHYDGVLGNPDLQSISGSRGFIVTRELLHQFSDQASEVSEPVLVAPLQSERAQSEGAQSGNSKAVVEPTEEAESLKLPEPERLPVPAPEGLPQSEPDPNA
jgi:hypothetical protein